MCQSQKEEKKDSQTMYPCCLTAPYGCEWRELYIKYLMLTTYYTTKQSGAVFSLSAPPEEYLPEYLRSALSVSSFKSGLSPHPKWDQKMVLSAFDKGGSGLSASAVCLACK